MFVEHKETGEVQEVIEEVEKGYVFKDGRIHDRRVWKSKPEDSDADGGKSTRPDAKRRVQSGRGSPDSKKGDTAGKGSGSAAEDISSSSSVLKGGSVK